MEFKIQNSNVKVQNSDGLIKTVLFGKEHQGIECVPEKF